MSKTDLQNYSVLAQVIEGNSVFIDAKALHGGLSTQCTSLEVRLPNGEMRRFVIRRPPHWLLEKYPDAASEEFRLLEFLYTRKLMVPKPILLDQKGLYLGTPSLILEFIEGGTAFSPNNAKETAEQMAIQSANLHSLDIEDTASWLKTIDPGTFMSNNKADYSTIEWEARSFLENNWPIPSNNPVVLVHGDFWPGNILWNNNQLVAVIDWEDAGIADPLLDIAITRLDLLLLFGKDVMDMFTDIYQSLSKTDLANLPYWDLWAATRPSGQIAQWATVYPGLGRPDVTVTSMLAGQQYFVQQAFGKI
jgi:aminoglycoside phosphotransferase (APT) family kinase protein